MLALVSPLFPCPPSLPWTIFTYARRGFGPNAIQAMTLISPSLKETFYKVASSNTSEEKRNIWFDIRHGQGTDGGELIAALKTKRDFVHPTASRAQFLGELVAIMKENGRVRTVFGKRVVDVVQDESGTTLVKFQDGGEVRVDAVVGCDGIRSACRRILLSNEGRRESFDAVYSGKYAYRKVVSMEKAIEAAGRDVLNRTVFVGHGAHILMFPIRNGKALNIVAFVDGKGKPVSMILGMIW